MDDILLKWYVLGLGVLCIIQPRLVGAMVAAFGLILVLSYYFNWEVKWRWM